MKQYYADAKLKREIQKTQYKKHPKWHKRKWVRRILFLFSIIIGIISFFYFNIDKNRIPEGFAEIMRINLAICMGGFASIPYLAYRKMLETSCACVTYYREHDTVIITEEDMKYIYHPSNQYDANIYEQLEIRYENITKIIYNKYHERVDIYGKHKEIWYSDYSKGKYTRNKNINKPDERIRLYLYFEGSEEIIETLQEKSPVEMEIIDCPAE